MKESELFKQSSQVIETADNLIAEFNIFNQKYNVSDEGYFEEKLIEMGYDAEDASTILINKDLLLSMFLNKFEIIEVDDVDTKIDINLEIEKVRKKYIDAVDNANEAIKAANEAKDIMLSTKQLIEEEYGINSNNWDNNTVHQLNESILIYNRLVDKANECTLIVKEVREELALVRCKYQQDKNDDAVKNADIITDNNVVFETS